MLDNSRLPETMGAWARRPSVNRLNALFCTAMIVVGVRYLWGQNSVFTVVWALFGLAVLSYFVYFGWIAKYEAKRDQ